MQVESVAPQSTQTDYGIREHIIALAVDMKHIAHDVKNLGAKVDALGVSFVPRRELEAQHSAQEARLSKLENDKTWLVRWVFAAWLAGLGTVGVMAKKLIG